MKMSPAAPQRWQIWGSGAQGIRTFEGPGSSAEIAVFLSNIGFGV